MSKLATRVEMVTQSLWVASVPTLHVSETGTSYRESVDALKETLERVIDHDVELDVVVYGIDD